MLKYDIRNFVTKENNYNVKNEFYRQQDYEKTNSTAVMKMAREQLKKTKLVVFIYNNNNNNNKIQQHSNTLSFANTKGRIV